MPYTRKVFASSKFNQTSSGSRQNWQHHRLLKCCCALKQCFQSLLFQVCWCLCAATKGRSLLIKFAHIQQKVVLRANIVNPSSWVFANSKLHRLTGMQLWAVDKGIELSKRNLYIIIVWVALRLLPDFLTGTPMYCNGTSQRLLLKAWIWYF